MKTASDKILEVLAGSVEPLPVHAFGIFSVSQTSISSRLRELARIGKVEGFYIEGKREKYWRLAESKEGPEFVYHPERWI